MWFVATAIKKHTTTKHGLNAHNVELSMTFDHAISAPNAKALIIHIDDMIQITLSGPDKFEKIIEAILFIQDLQLTKSEKDEYQELLNEINCSARKSIQIRSHKADRKRCFCQ